MAETSASVVRPEKGTHRKAPLLGKVAGHRQAILEEEEVELPLGHRLVVSFGVPWIVQRQLKVAASTPLLLCLPVGHRASLHLHWLHGCLSLSPSSLDSMLPRKWAFYREKKWWLIRLKRDMYHLIFWSVVPIVATSACALEIWPNIVRPRNKTQSLAPTPMACVLVMTMEE